MDGKIINVPISKLKPYKNNPRKISQEAVDAVAESIKQFGFRGTLQIEADGTIINGHTRARAAKQLGMTELPCEVVDNLSAEKIRQYRLVDNKSAEYSKWDADRLTDELLDLDFGELDFDFDFSGDVKKQKKWQEIKKLCDLKDHMAMRKAIDTYYHSLFKVGKNGKPLEELKTEAYVPMFAETALEFIKGTTGGNLCECDWCLVTTPRRRHADGFHFATAVCRWIADDLRIPFREDTITCKSKQRIDPVFTLAAYPPEKNILLYDDIITTGETLNTARNLLIEAGYTVAAVVSIDNH